MMAAALSVASCISTVSEPVTVLFSLSGVRAGTLTKAADGNEIDAALTATNPPDDIVITLTSTSVSTRVYTATIGTPVTLPADTYRVTGNYKPRAVGDAVGNDIYKSPSYAIDETVTIGEEGGQYPLTARYTCFALVIDYTENAMYRHWQGNAVGWVEFPHFTRTGDVGVAYIGLDYIWDSINYQLKVIPKDMINYEETLYTLVGKARAGCFKVEAGRWYAFSASGVATVAGDLSISFPAWIDGN